MSASTGAIASRSMRGPPPRFPQAGPCASYGHKDVAAPVQEPRQSLREVRGACESILPGFVFRRHLLFRYSVMPQAVTSATWLYHAHTARWRRLGSAHRHESGLATSRSCGFANAGVRQDPPARQISATGMSQIRLIAISQAGTPARSPREAPTDRPPKPGPKRHTGPSGESSRA